MQYRFLGRAHEEVAEAHCCHLYSDGTYKMPLQSVVYSDLDIAQTKSLQAGGVRLTEYLLLSIFSTPMHFLK